MTKSPDEIKKGLECCSAPREDEQCRQCPYAPNNGYCVDKLTRDALWYMVELKAENVQRADRIIRLEAERDAAINDIMHTCATCKHYFFNKADGSDCEYDCMDGPDGCHNGNTRWEWCGVTKEE